MNSIINKFKSKEFMQKMIIELAGDLILLVIGIVFAYYFKMAFFG